MIAAVSARRSRLCCRPRPSLRTTSLKPPWLRSSSVEARREAEALAPRAGFRLAPAALDLLVESLAANIARIAVEIEKLALFAGGRPIGQEDIAALVPDARAGNIFELVNALGR